MNVRIMNEFTKITKDNVGIIVNLDKKKVILMESNTYITTHSNNGEVIEVILKVNFISVI